MRLPFAIKSGLSSGHQRRWQDQFVANNRAVFESIWRRTQDIKNANLSGWTSSTDQRRRMLHYYDTYDVVNEGTEYAFKLIAPYLWLSLAFPENEIAEYESRISRALEEGGWKKADNDIFNSRRVFVRGDLIFTISNPKSYLADKKSGRSFPENYRLLDVVLTSTMTNVPVDRLSHPWDVFETGIRKKDTRGNPKLITNLQELEPFFPAQVELGCGPSIEVGIPPLHYLHRVYYVSDPVTHKFILSPSEDNLLVDILSNPEVFFQHSSLPYLNSITAEQNEFFQLLKKLHDQKYIVGDIITNNFDGLSSLVGLQERYVRQYGEVDIIPHIDFHPDAQALIVFGSHADRRRIQHSAREQGLKVIYIDPEGYHENGSFLSYPLESPQDTDMLVHMTAGEFSKKIRDEFPELFSC